MNALVRWFINRRARKALGLSRKEYGMLKKMFIDNWFSTLSGIIGAAIQAHQAGGVSWKTALIAAAGVVIKDAVPGLGDILGPKKDIAR